MAVNSNGSDNRVAGRDYHEKNIQIAQYDGRHTVNIAIPSDKNEKRPLVKAQRRQLNELVGKIVVVSKDESYVVWNKLHAEIGVESIDEMTVDQYLPAVSFLNTLLERGQEEKSNKILVRELLSNSSDKKIRLKLIRFCYINFGTGRFNDLTHSQLQMAIAWLDQQSIQGASRLNCSIKTKSNFKNIISNHKREISVFILVLIIILILYK